MSQLNDILENIAAIQLGMYIVVPADVTGGSTMTQTYPYEPADASQAQLPFIFNQYKGGPAKVEAVTGMQAVQSRIDMVICVERVDSQRLQTDALRLTILWRDAMLIAMASNVRLGNYPYITDAQITQVGPMEIVKLGSTDYWGMAFTFTVRELFPVTITA